MKTLDALKLRAVSDLNGDGKLSATEATFGQFRRLVTNAEVSKTGAAVKRAGGKTICEPVKVLGQGRFRPLRRDVMKCEC